MKIQNLESLKCIIYNVQESMKNNQTCKGTGKWDPQSSKKKRKIETEVNETKVLELAKKRFNCHAYVQEIKENMLTEMNK